MLTNHANTQESIENRELAMLDFVQSSALPIQLYRKGSEKAPEAKAFENEHNRNRVLDSLTAFAEELKAAGLQLREFPTNLAYRGYAHPREDFAAYVVYTPSGGTIFVARLRTYQPESFVEARVFDATKAHVGAALKVLRSLVVAFQ